MRSRPQRTPQYSCVSSQSLRHGSERHTSSRTPSPAKSGDVLSSKGAIHPGCSQALKLKKPSTGELRTSAEGRLSGSNETPLGWTEPQAQQHCAVSTGDSGEGQSSGLSGCDSTLLSWSATPGQGQTCSTSHCRDFLCDSLGNAEHKSVIHTVRTVFLLEGPQPKFLLPLSVGEEDDSFQPPSNPIVSSSSNIQVLNCCWWDL